MVVKLQMKLIIEVRKINIPHWLDADFLYRINYGPATIQDANVAQKYLVAHNGMRERLTLLDRQVADSLHQALFSSNLASGRGFSTTLIRTGRATDSSKRTN